MLGHQNGRDLTVRRADGKQAAAAPSAVPMRDPPILHVAISEAYSGGIRQSENSFAAQHHRSRHYSLGPRGTRTNGLILTRKNC